MYFNSATHDHFRLIPLECVIGSRCLLWLHLDPRETLLLLLSQPRTRAGERGDHRTFEMLDLTFVNGCGARRTG
jgi:hypothetical protein